ncbi:hypothetical protein HDV00_005628 [Rhizophlyctis rosea]|nr:hypothetical protein HDV00_005628 [Rhizophlyctis rosea]
MTARAEFRLRPATVDDVPTLIRIRNAAFAPSPVSRGFFPSGVIDDETLALRHEELLKELADPKIHYVVAVLQPTAETPQGVPEPQQAKDHSGEIIAWVKWVEHLEDTPEEEWNRPIVFTRQMVGPTINLDLFNDFIGGMKTVLRDSVQGKAHMIISFLVTDPQHQGTGAGSLLLKHVLTGLDTLNVSRSTPLDCWLEASPAGYPLYRKLGFEDAAVSDVDLVGRHKLEPTDAERQQDLRTWGKECGTGVGGPLRDGWFRTVIMKRPGKVGQ